MGYRFNSLIHFFAVGAVIAAVSACSSTPDKDRIADREKVESELSQEMSLKADRQRLDDLRKDLPPEVKQTNDELALFLDLMRQGKEAPQLVRDKYQALVRKRRTSFREKVQKLREDYKRDEQSRRDTFLNKQKEERTSFVRRKHTSQESRVFFADQDKRRQAFFSDERSRRQNFESEINGQSKDFDSYMREKQKEFDEQYRLYSKKFSERPKGKNAVTGDDEFQRLDQVPTTPLGTED